jgi:hypothetical protein
MGVTQEGRHATALAEELVGRMGELLADCLEDTADMIEKKQVSVSSTDFEDIIWSVPPHPPPTPPARPGEDIRGDRTRFAGGHSIPIPCPSHPILSRPISSFRAARSSYQAYVGCHVQTRTVFVVQAAAEDDQPMADEDEEEDDKPIYNPLNLPLGWDGKG